MTTRSLAWPFCLALIGCATASQPTPYQPQVVEAFRSFAANAPGTWKQSNAAGSGVTAPQISLGLANAAASDRCLGVVTVTDSEGKSQQLVAYFANVTPWTPPIINVFCATEMDSNGNLSGTSQVLFLQQEEPGHWLLVRFDPESISATLYRRQVAP
jgi:hypothetical protein